SGLRATAAWNRRRRWCAGWRSAGRPSGPAPTTRTERSGQETQPDGGRWPPPPALRSARAARESLMQEEAILADAGTVMSAVNGGRGAAPEPGAGLLALLAPKPGERILDLGCGDGALTARIAAAGADVVGVDCCPDMVAAARARGLDVVLAD